MQYCIKKIKEFTSFLTKNQKEISNGGMEKILKKRCAMSFKAAVKRKTQTENDLSNEQKKTLAFILRKILENNSLIVSIDEKHLSIINLCFK